MQSISIDDVWFAGLIPEKSPTPNPARPADDQVECCREWIRAYCTPRKTMNTKYSSYSLKHVVESWTEGKDSHYKIPLLRHRWPHSRKYISNGAFIKAALLEGYEARPTAYASDSAYFNISLAQVSPVVQEMKLAVAYEKSNK
jgi:hypothetical protein